MKSIKPGVYHDVPFDEYLQWDAISNSRLGLAKRSAAHFKQGFKSEPTPAMRLGSLVHCGVLEPLAIAKRYCFMPNYSEHPENVTTDGARSFSSATKFVKSMEKQFRTLHHDKEIVSEPEYDRMVGVAGSLSSSSVVRDLMRSGRPEVSIVWVDEESGLICKLRADWLHTEQTQAVVIDVKTTVDGLTFENAIARYGYHRQMAFYRRGIKAALGLDAMPWIIAVESSSPYLCRVAPIADESLRIGESEVDELLGFIAECRAVDAWPGYSNPDKWRCPGWYANGNREPVELLIGDEVLTV
jgi:exodeoxyribonuclease VIII